MNRNQRKDKGHEAGGRKSPSNKPEPREWVVVILDAAKNEGHKILNPFRYEYVKAILKRLVDFGDDEELCDLDIRTIEDFWELRTKGGVLGKINLRVYFATVAETGELVIAKAYKKEDEDQTPRYIIIGVQERVESYRVGMQRRATVYQRGATDRRGHSREQTTAIRKERR